jgi:hypothetical protein
MQNLLHNGLPEQDMLFRDSQPRELLDSNNGGYINKPVIFDTMGMVNELIDYRETDLQIPLTIYIDGTLSDTNNLGVLNGTVGATGPAANTFVNGVSTTTASNTGGTVTGVVVAFKESILSLISGINVTTGDGKVIVSEQNSLPLINHIRMLVQNNKDWEAQFEEEFAFAKNTSRVVTNTGLKQRAGYLINNSVVTYYHAPAVTTGLNEVAYISRIQTLVNIPFRYLHSFFDNMDAPQKGIRWRFEFNLCNELNSNALYKGFNIDSTVATAVVPKFYIGDSGGRDAPRINNTTYTKSLLRYRVITLPNAIQQQVSAMTLDGHLSKRYIKFAITDFYNQFSNTTANLSSAQVSTGVVKPIRMWVLGFKAGVLTDQKEVNATSLQLQSLQVRVNTKNRYDNALQNPYDLWSEVKQQMQCLSFANDKGSLLDFTDFLNKGLTAPIPLGRAQSGLYSYYCVDLSRLQDRTDDQALQIMIDSVRAENSTSIDYVILIEREAICKMEYLDNTCSIQVGSTLD